MLGPLLSFCYLNGLRNRLSALPMSPDSADNLEFTVLLKVIELVENSINFPLDFR